MFRGSISIISSNIERINIYNMTQVNLSVHDYQPLLSLDIDAKKREIFLLNK